MKDPFHKKIGGYETIKCWRAKDYFLCLICQERVSRWRLKVRWAAGQAECHCKGKKAAFVRVEEYVTFRGATWRCITTIPSRNVVPEKG